MVSHPNLGHFALYGHFLEIIIYWIGSICLFFIWVALVIQDNHFWGIRGMGSFIIRHFRIAYKEFYQLRLDPNSEQLHFK